MLKNKKLVKKFFLFFLFLFSIIGVIFVSVFISLKLGLLNVKGSISERNSYFNINRKEAKAENINDFNLACKINVLNKYAPTTSLNIYNTLMKTNDFDLVSKMLNMASVRFNNDLVFKNKIEKCSNNILQEFDLAISAYEWADTDEWSLMKNVFTRDQDIIKKAAEDAGVSPRLILSCVIGEQFRFFSNRRESFKSYFEPLKILASLSNISYGIAGIKPKTILQIEENLKNEKSSFYLGSNMRNITGVKDVITEEEVMDRITNTKNPYYSYLYVGLFINQIIHQWNSQGYDISKDAGILATLYNLGFYYSSPKENPEIGGAVINIAGKDYTFGDIGHEFYYSGELSDIFPIR